MNTLKKLSLALVVALTSTTLALAEEGDVVVLTNAKNPTKAISKARAKSIYLGAYAFWSGVVPIKVLMRSTDIEASQVFLTNVVETSAQKFDQHWTSRQLAGKGVKPAKVKNLDELVESLRKNPGAIGFALESELEGVDLSGLKTLDL